MSVTEPADDPSAEDVDSDTDAYVQSNRVSEWREPLLYRGIKRIKDYF